ncbi:hypothetical protein RvY_04496 [Ramazzottius varieornatus]|uniref:Uncharacterized protein n=1 Tax=Ramazzottius varieornatus TaxID=947166 RepID=A0A1D1V114_RAMVA|nr:hypothetical protein RvY_04496 [Ramazzottius varieornatus]
MDDVLGGTTRKTSIDPVKTPKSPYTVPHVSLHGYTLGCLLGINVLAVLLLEEMPMREAVHVRLREGCTAYYELSYFLPSDMADPYSESSLPASFSVRPKSERDLTGRRHFGLPLSGKEWCKARRVHSAALEEVIVTGL